RLAPALPAVLRFRKAPFDFRKEVRRRGCRRAPEADQDRAVRKDDGRGARTAIVVRMAVDLDVPHLGELSRGRRFRVYDRSAGERRERATPNELSASNALLHSSPPSGFCDLAALSSCIARASAVMCEIAYH